MSSLEIITDPFERSGVAAVNSPRRIERCFCLLVMFTRKLEDRTFAEYRLLAYLVE